MTKLMRGLAMIAALLLTAEFLAAPALAESKPGKKAGILHVYGNADTKLFSEDGIKRAESAMHSTLFEGGMMLTVDTYPEVPASKKAEADQVKNDKAQWRTFMNNWAIDRAKDDKAKGIYVLICQRPGGVAVRSTKETLDRGFSNSDAEKIQDSLIHALRESRDKPEAERWRINDQALHDAVNYIVDDLKDSHVPVSATTKSDNKKAGMSVGGWICLGLCILLGVWLVIGIIRALTGGGGGYGGGGYGGGGGGGGFGSSLLGGLFGAMAGMWLYNSMFGGHHDMGSNDAFAGDSAGDTGGETGADNWDDGGGSAGGYDSGGDGGGDWGGGGGDFGGGGGDFGGGDFGGDF
jgi:hypothetical protein